MTTVWRRLFDLIAKKDPGDEGLSRGTATRFLSVVMLITVLLLLICYAKGEPPGWRWGK